MLRMADYLRQRFTNSDLADHYAALLTEYWDSGLAPPNMLTEITGGDRGLYAHIWESMLYRHLQSLGFAFRQGRVTKVRQRGPDFGIVHGGQTIWVEAITASPEGIPADYLRPPAKGEFKSGTFPHEAILLRWTSALRDKRAKLQSYVADGIIADTEATVIAINGCRLTGGYQDYGITQLPFAVEAVFPVGPLAAPINVKTGRIMGEAAHIPRYSIQKRNGAPVPTDCFLNPDYANVGAILGCGRGHMLHGLPLSIVHNPLATIRVPEGLLQAGREYTIADEGDVYSLRRLNEDEAERN
jgi:hypothetical protein